MGETGQTWARTNAFPPAAARSRACWASCSSPDMTASTMPSSWSRWGRGSSPAASCPGRPSIKSGTQMAKTPDPSVCSSNEIHFASGESSLVPSASNRRRPTLAHKALTSMGTTVAGWLVICRWNVVKTSPVIDRSPGTSGTSDTATQGRLVGSSRSSASPSISSTRAAWR